MSNETLTAAFIENIDDKKLLLNSFEINLVDHNFELINKIKKLTEENKKLIKTLEFYAIKDNWSCCNCKEDSGCIGVSVMANDYGSGLYAGNLARQTLKELGE